MDRIEFIILTTFILFVTFAIGWAANWAVHRFIRVSKSDLGELDKMANSLHEAEEMRDQAIAYVHERENELQNRISQTEAELKAAMEGLHAARSENDNLQDYIEKNKAKG